MPGASAGAIAVDAILGADIQLAEEIMGIQFHHVRILRGAAIPEIVTPKFCQGIIGLNRAGIIRNDTAAVRLGFQSVSTAEVVVHLELTVSQVRDVHGQSKEARQEYLCQCAQKIHGDGYTVTEICNIPDLKSRDIVSFAIGKSHSNHLVFDTFDLAIRKNPDAYPLFHSDRGFQYTNKVFKSKLDKQGMQLSMSQVGKCIDNGPMEGFWRILKCEMYHLNQFDTHDELVAAIEAFVSYYNHQRRQHKLNCLPPATYRRLLEAA